MKRQPTLTGHEEDIPTTKDDRAGPFGHASTDEKHSRLTEADWNEWRFLVGLGDVLVRTEGRVEVVIVHDGRFRGKIGESEMTDDELAQTPEIGGKGCFLFLGIELGVPIVMVAQSDPT